MYNKNFKIFKKSIAFFCASALIIPVFLFAQDEVDSSDIKNEKAQTVFAVQDEGNSIFIFTQEKDDEFIIPVIPEMISKESSETSKATNETPEVSYPSVELSGGTKIYGTNEIHDSAVSEKDSADSSIEGDNIESDNIETEIFVVPANSEYDYKDSNEESPSFIIITSEESALHPEPSVSTPSPAPKPAQTPYTPPKPMPLPSIAAPQTQAQSIPLPSISIIESKPDVTDPAKLVVKPKNDPAIFFEFEGKPAAGYTWSYVMYPTGIVKEVKGALPKEGSQIIGSGSYPFAFQAVQPGRTKLVFSYKRPWENKAPLKEAVYIINVSKNMKVTVDSFN
ncbi:MAG: hypothetical protein Ta2F_02240 [Termitinemataceae bacterium]|nr:MAG: hypothetical protein Ta2F_02240 [Termitinemataceae bacterium]